ncbi:uncharacterized protein LOC113324573 [Papaver somniferum]|uniref:uncharacterized protein LOC113324573 n=1 Tax=Papaver somniferum TaxID=3469 RepID=UPI000E6F9FCF|nr:uncharacterized protein LOC113324573 [Papaver somniferum]
MDKTNSMANYPNKITDLTNLRRDLAKWYAIKERKDKSKDQNIVLGDKNTRFFHNRAKQRFRRNRIETLKDENNVWLNKKEEISDCITSHFQKIATTLDVNYIGSEGSTQKVEGLERMGQRSGQRLALKVKEGLRKSLTTFLGVLVEIKPGKVVEVEDGIAEFLEEFADTMPAELPKSQPPRRRIDHMIELVSWTRSHVQAQYRMSPFELEEMRKHICELLEPGYIQPSKAQFGAPVLFQKKQDGALRMCVDYMDLNKLTVKNKYPIQLVVDLFDRLAKAKSFTKLDLRSGHYKDI